MMPPHSEVNGNSDNLTFSHGTKGQPEKSGTVIQDEPGVYITLSPLPNGRNELKHVRFRYVFIILSLKLTELNSITEPSSITTLQYTFDIC